VVTTLDSNIKIFTSGKVYYVDILTNFSFNQHLGL